MSLLEEKADAIVSILRGQYAIPGNLIMSVMDLRFRLRYQGITDGFGPVLIGR